MRIAIVALTAVACLVHADLLAQRGGNSCAPPSYTGPDGPRAPQPAPGTPSNDTPVPTGDTGRPSTPTDPVTGPTTDPRQGPSTPRGGMPLPLTRGKTAKKRHVIQWSWPKPATEAAEERLDYEGVLATVRGEDPRPLLILREGSQYGPGYDKMLSQKFENESIALLARWFHCVRFSESIMDDAHPWRALFSGEYPPQCFVVTWDGHNNEILSGIFSISRIQTSMRKILAKEYSKDVDQALTKWKRVLDKFDTLDAKVGDMRERIEALSIERGPDSAQVRTMKARLAKLEKEQSAIEKEEAAVLDLGLARKASDGKSKLLDRLRTQR